MTTPRFCPRDVSSCVRKCVKKNSPRYVSSTLPSVPPSRARIDVGAVTVMFAVVTLSVVNTNGFDTTAWLLSFLSASAALAAVNGVTGMPL